MKVKGIICILVGLLCFGGISAQELRDSVKVHFRQGAIGLDMNEGNNRQVLEEIREKLDLIKLLVKHRASTFFFRVSGVSMVDAAMDEGDIIIVDRSIEPYNNCIAVCYIDGEYTVKRVEMQKGCAYLIPANENNKSYQPIKVTSDNEFIIWGVVTWTIKKM